MSGHIVLAFNIFLLLFFLFMFDFLCLFLLSDEFGIDAVGMLLKEGVVVADLGELALLQHDDLISIADG